MFQSLLYEACGRTVNPVNGAVGLLGTGNWHVCQAAVETVLRGGTLRPMPELLNGVSTPDSDEASEAEVTCTDMFKVRDPNSSSRSKAPKRKRPEEAAKAQCTDLDLRLTPGFAAKVSSRGLGGALSYVPETYRPATSSMNSEDSVTTTYFDIPHSPEGERKLLNLFP